MGIIINFLTSYLIIKYKIPTVKIRPKGQVTIPTEILKAWRIDINDRVDVNLVNGIVTLTPEKRSKNKKSIMSYAGIGAGLWGDSVEDIDNFINNERDSWEK